MDTQNKERIQEVQYEFPYHHLSYEVNGGIFIFKHLFWGLVHLTYIKYVIERISHLEFETLSDIGCGEGRIICELEKKNLSKKFLGVDISTRAISFAKAFSNDSEFLVHDITQKPLEDSVDLIVSCEVIEHIEPTKVKSYIDNIHASLKENGKSEERREGKERRTRR